MSAKKVSIQQLPEKLRHLTMMHQDPSSLDIYECKEREDLYTLSSQYPFETTVVANNTNSTKTITGYFMVGLAVPNRADPFHKPVMAYYYMDEHAWRIHREDVAKEVERRKKQWNETRSGWKNLRS